MPIVITKEALAFGAELCEDDPRVLVEINCGLHSGFPRCCIAFFVKVWRHWMWPQDGSDLIASYHRFLEANDMLLGTGYVPCPSCVLSHNVVTVKHCHCHRQRTVRYENESIPVLRMGAKESS